jgi:hypothetical protein
MLPVRGIYVCLAPLSHVVAAAFAGVCLLLCTPWEAEATGGSYIDVGR